MQQNRAWQGRKAALVLAVLTLLGGLAFYVVRPDNGPAAELRAARTRLEAAGSYLLQIKLEQLLTPQATPGMIGQQEQRLTFSGEGAVVLPDRSTLTLRTEGQAQRAPLRLVNAGGRSFIQEGAVLKPASATDTTLPLPAQSMLAYLDAATNVRVEQLTSAGAARTLYHFDLDSTRMLQVLRQAAGVNGPIPAGASSPLRDMGGTGQLWVDAQGLPIRQQITLRLPNPTPDYAVTAKLDLHFSAIGKVRELAQPVQDHDGTWKVANWHQPPGGGGGRIAIDLLLSENIPPLLPGLLAILAALFALSLIVMLARRNLRRAYLVVALPMALLISVQPLLLPGDVGGLRAQAVEAAEQQKEALAAEQALAQAELQQATSNSACGTGSQTDDTDRDELTDFVENCIGTDPYNYDSDGDLIDDKTELDGFVLSGKTWMTDPLSRDSNRDGQVDTIEWPQPWGSATITDTNGNNIPDLWDDDNDGDAVVDSLDISPQASTDLTTSFQLQLTNRNAFSDSGATYVQLQIRPENPDQLRYSLSALDWPQDDKGQITDLDDTGSYTEADLRLTPMLEIDTNDAPELAADYSIVVERNRFGGVEKLFVPLQPVEQNGQVVAWNARVAYRDNEAFFINWKAQLVWIAQAQIDRYVNCNDEANATPNAESCSLETGNKIVQRYSGIPFRLTGLEVSRSRNVEALVMGAPRSSNEDTTLYALLYGMQSTYLAAEVLDGQLVDRSMGAELEARFNNGATPPEQMFNITDTIAVSRTVYRAFDEAVQGISEELISRYLAANRYAEAPTSQLCIFDGGRTAPCASIVVAMEQQVAQAGLTAPDDGIQSRSLRFDLAGDDFSFNTTRSILLERYSFEEGKWKAIEIPDAVAVEHRRYDYPKLASELANKLAGVTETDLRTATYDHIIEWMIGKTRTIKLDNQLIVDEISSANRAPASGISSSKDLPVVAATDEYYSKKQRLLDKNIERKYLATAAQRAAIGCSSLQACDAEAVKRLTRAIIGPELIDSLGISISETASDALNKTSLTQASRRINGGKYELPLDQLPNSPVARLASSAASSLSSVVPADSKTGRALNFIQQANLADEFPKAAKILKAVGKVLNALGPIGFAIELGLIWSSFGISVTNGMPSYALNAAITYAVVATVVAIVLFALMFVPGADIVGAIIGLIDFIVSLATDGEVSLAILISKALYGAEVISKLDDMSFVGGDTISLSDSQAGFVAGNRLSYQDIFKLTFGLKDDDFKRVQAYAQSDVANLTTGHGSFVSSNADAEDATVLLRNDSEDCTTDNKLIRKECQNTASASFELLRPKRNMDLGLIWKVDFSYAYAECTAAGNIILSALNVRLCFKVSGASDSIDESSQKIPLTLDVLPSTPDELWSWSELNGPDRDADGAPDAQEILSSTNTLTSTWDSDGDGISDGVELGIGLSTSGPVVPSGLNPTKADSDGDGLNDADELRWSTDPTVADSDGDGLTDGEEVPQVISGALSGGWLVTPIGASARRVFSDPLDADSDGDALSDGVEKAAASSPLAFNEAPVLALDLRPLRSGPDGTTLKVVRPGEPITLSLDLASLALPITTTLDLCLPVALTSVGGGSLTRVSATGARAGPATQGPTTQPCGTRYRWSFAGADQLLQGETISTTFNATLNSALSSSTTLPITLSLPYRDQIITATTQLVVDADAPSVLWSGPAAGAFLRGTSIVVGGVASDPTSWVQRVAVKLPPSTSFGTANGTDAWAASWTLPADGVYTLEAQSIDGVGRGSAIVSRQVTVDNTPPTLATSLVDNAFVPIAEASQGITLTGSAADNLAGLVRVQLSIDGRAWQNLDLTGSFPTASSWQYLWRGAGQGTHTLRLRAFDRAGNASAVLSRSVIVDSVAPANTLTTRSYLASPAPVVKAGTALTLTGYINDAGNVPIPLRPRSDLLGSVSSVATATVWLEFPRASEALSSTATWLGDINGDGLGDLAVGMPNADSGAGRVTIIYGQGGDWNAAPLANALGDSRSTFVGRPGARLGAHLAPAGDVNGDGLFDLLIGDLQNNQVFVVFGRQNIFGRDRLLDSGQTNDWSVVSAPTGMRIGSWQSAAGNINGDSTDDLLIGVVPTSGSGAGQLFVVAGRTTGWQANLALPEAATAQYPFPGTGSLARGLGDVNGDQIDDWALLDSAAGQLSLFLGDAGLRRATSGPVIQRDTASRTASLPLATGAGADALALGDVNGDQLGDFVYRGGSGAPQLVLGRASGSWSLSFAFTGYTPSLSWLAAPGDVNADGLNDILLGGTQGGQQNAYLFLGAGSLPARPNIQATFTGVVGAASAPYAAGADLNCDASSDLLLLPEQTRSDGRLPAGLSYSELPAVNLDALPIARTTASGTGIGTIASLVGGPLSPPALPAGTPAVSSWLYVDDDYCASCSNDGLSWGVSAFSDPQLALNAATSNTQIVLRPGSYGRLVLTNSATRVQNVWITGVNADAVFVDGGGTGSAIRVTGMRGGGLSGLTVRNAAIGVELLNVGENTATNPAHRFTVEKLLIIGFSQRGLSLDSTSFAVLRRNTLSGAAAATSVYVDAPANTFEATVTTPQTDTAQAGLPGTVYATAIDHLGNYYIGGDFRKVGDVPANYLAVWRPSTGRWEQFGSGVNGPVYTLVISWTNNPVDASWIGVGGAFTASANGATIYNKVGMIRGGNNVLEPLSSGLPTQGGPVYALEWEFSPSALIAGGAFDDPGFRDPAGTTGAPNPGQPTCDPGPDEIAVYNTTNYNGAAPTAWCQVLGAGVYANITALNNADLQIAGSPAAAAFSSIRVGSFVTVTLYTGENFTGNALTIADSDNSDLGPTFAQQVRSMRIVTRNTSRHRIARYNMSSQSWGPYTDGISGVVRAVAYADDVTYIGGDIPSYDPPQDDTCNPGPDQVALFDLSDFNRADPVTPGDSPCLVLNVGDYANLPSFDNTTTSLRVGGRVEAIVYGGLNFGGSGRTYSKDDRNLGTEGISNLVRSVQVRWKRASHNVTRWNSALDTFEPLGPGGVGGTVSTIRQAGSNYAAIGGSFSYPGNNITLWLGGIPDQWQLYESADRSENGANGPVYAIVPGQPGQGDIFGGAFTRFQGQDAPGLAGFVSNVNPPAGVVRSIAIGTYVSGCCYINPYIVGGASLPGGGTSVARIDQNYVYRQPVHLTFSQNVIAAPQGLAAPRWLNGSGSFNNFGISYDASNRWVADAGASWTPSIASSSLNFSQAQFRDVARSNYRVGATSVLTQSGYYQYAPDAIISPSFGPGQNNEGLIWGQTAFSSIQQAIDKGAQRITLRPGRYQESLTLVNGLELLGAGADTTIIEAPIGTQASTLIDAGGARNLRIAGLTLAGDNRLDGLRANGAQLNFSRSIVRDTLSGVRLRGTSSAIELANLSFANNSYGVEAQGTSVDVRNSLFLGHTIAALSYTTGAGITILHPYNAFWQNSRNYRVNGSFQEVPQAGVVVEDPVLSDPLSNDFRPLAFSPLLGAGNPSDPTPPGTGGRVDIGYLQQGRASVYVDDGYTPTGINDGLTWGVDAFNRIQDGLNAAAQAAQAITCEPDLTALQGCARISVGVGAGRYTETLTLPSRVQLVGSGAEVTTLSAGGSGVPVTAQDTSEAEVAGLTITGAGSGLPALRLSGAARGVSLNRVLLRGTFIGVQATGSASGQVSFSTLANIATGAQVTGSSKLNVANSLIVATTTGLEATSGGTIVSDYNLLQAPTAFSGTSAGANDQVGLDPQFVNAGAGDYRLRVGSPALDSADPFESTPAGGGDVADRGYAELESIPLALLPGKQGQSCQVGNSGAAKVELAAIPVADASLPVTATLPAETDWRTVFTSNTRPIAAYWTGSVTPAGDGLYRLYSRASDTMGNASLPSQRYLGALAADGTAPSIGWLTPPPSSFNGAALEVVGQVSDYLNVGGVWRFTAESPVIEVVSGTQILRYPTSWDDTGWDLTTRTPRRFAATLPLPQGTVQVQAVASDTVGNTTRTSSASVVVTRVNTANVTSPDSGSATDGNTVALAGLASFATTSSSAVVVLTRSGAGQPNATVQATLARPDQANSAWTAEMPLPADGVYTINAQAGVGGPLSAATNITLTRDTTPPTLNIATPPAFVTSTLSLNGSASDTGSGLAAVELSVDSGVNWLPATLNGTTWSYEGAVPALGDGERLTVLVRATDRATTSATATTTVTADLVPPPALEGLTSNIPVQSFLNVGQSFTLSWLTPTVGSELRLLIDTVPSTTVTRANGTLISGTSSEVSFTAPGTFYIHLASLDAAGNATQQDLGPFYAGSAADLQFQLDGVVETADGEWLPSMLLDDDERANPVQSFYGAADGAGLYLGWQGASWSFEQSALLIYFGTGSGGNTTPIAGTTPGRTLPFAARFAVVITSTASSTVTGTLYEASGGAWTLSSRTWDWAHDAASGGTEVTLPFLRRGTGPLQILALTARDGAAWSLFPTTNPLNGPWDDAYSVPVDGAAQVAPAGRVPGLMAPPLQSTTGGREDGGLGASQPRAYSLELTADAPSPLVGPGDSITLTLTVESGESSVTLSPALVLTGQGGLSYQTLEGVSCASCSADASTWTIIIPNLAPGQTRLLTVTAKAPASASALTPLTTTLDLRVGSQSVRQTTLSSLLDGQAPQITINGAVQPILAAGPVLFSGNADDGVGGGVAQVEVLPQGGSWTPLSGTVNWSTELNVPQASNYTLQARATDRFGNTSPITEVVFAVDTVSPTASLVLPATLSTTTVVLTGTAQDPFPVGGEIEPSLIEFATAGISSTVDRITNLIRTDNAYNWRYSWQVPVADGLPYQVRVQAQDRAGNFGLPTAWQTTTVDTVAPIITPTQVLTEIQGGGNSTPAFTGAVSDGSGVALLEATTYLSGTVLAVERITPVGGSWSYSPRAVASGLYQIQFRAVDNVGNATLMPPYEVRVTNLPPVANADAYTTDEDVPLNIAPPGLLANDNDSDTGTVLSSTLLNAPTRGQISLGLNGGFIYTPTANLNGTDIFTYTVSDGILTATAPVTLTVQPVNDPPTIAVAAGGACLISVSPQGTINLSIADIDSPISALTVRLLSTSNTNLVPTRNVKFGGSGANRTLTVETVLGRTGTAVLTIQVSDGTQSITLPVTVAVGTNVTGTAGADILFGQIGASTLNGGAGNDLLCGRQGRDTLNGGEGADTLDGGLGDDILNGGPGADMLRGGLGDDRLTGGAEIDSFNGDLGRDRATDRVSGETATSIEIFGP